MNIIKYTTLAVTFHVASFVVHPFFHSFEVKPELVPDFKVTYYCNEYEKMEGLHMKDNGDNTVTVNYGGFGRRRGFRNFKCK